MISLTKMSKKKYYWGKSGFRAGKDPREFYALNLHLSPERNQVLRAGEHTPSAHGKQNSPGKSKPASPSARSGEEEEEELGLLSAIPQQESLIGNIPTCKHLP